MARTGFGPERTLIVLHRWTGIALALLMLLWTVSGVVMLYVAFPELTEAEQLAGSEPLRLDECCAAGALADLDGEREVTVAMLAGRPVARVGAGTLDLQSGTWLDDISPQAAEAIAASHLQQQGMAGSVVATESIDNDQWTVYRRFERHRPLYRITFDSSRGDILYVSGTSGEVVQDTGRRERFWNWLGAVPHWLYYTALRERQALWYWFVVYTSLFGTLLAISGVYLGVRRTLGAGGRWTRYRGPMRWHHLTGLVFGIVTVTWVLSGLFSMNPWGLLESEGAGAEIRRIEGDGLDADALADTLAAARNSLDDGTVRLVLSSIDRDQAMIAVNKNGERRRLDRETLAAKEVSPQLLRSRLALMRPDAAVRSLDRLVGEDAYYFGHKSTVRLPVYRVILDDADDTRYYFDAATGELLLKADPAYRWYRWLHYGLHRLDFGQALRSRPLWDLVMLPLLAGVALLCGIGCWVGYRHLRYG